MPQSLPDTTPPKRRFRWPTGMPQLAALLLVLLVDSLVAPHFWQVVPEIPLAELSVPAIMNAIAA